MRDELNTDKTVNTEQAFKNLEQTVSQEFEQVAEQINDQFSDALEEISRSTAQLISVSSNKVSSVLATLILFLTEDEWSFTRTEARDTIRLEFSGDNGTWTCVARVRENDEQLIIYSLAPLKAPPRKTPCHRRTPHPRQLRHGHRQLRDGLQRRRNPLQNQHRRRR